MVSFTGQRPQDERRVRLTLTEKGKTLHRDAQPVQVKSRRRWGVRRDLKAVRKELRRIRTALLDARQQKKRQQKQHPPVWTAPLAFLTRPAQATATGRARLQDKAAAILSTTSARLARKHPVQSACG